MCKMLADDLRGSSTAVSTGLFQIANTLELISQFFSWACLYPEINLLDSCVNNFQWLSYHLMSFCPHTHLDIWHVKRDRYLNLRGVQVFSATPGECCCQESEWSLFITIEWYPTDYLQERTQTTSDRPSDFTGPSFTMSKQNRLLTLKWESFINMATFGVIADLVRSLLTSFSMWKQHWYQRKSEKIASIFWSYS